MKRFFIEIVKCVCSLAMIPLWFIKMFHGEGHLPDKVTGEIVKVDFYHSMFENITAVGHLYLAYVSFFLIALNILFFMFGIMTKQRREVTITGHIIFIVSIIYFFVMMLFASTVSRGY